MPIKRKSKAPKPSQAKKAGALSKESVSPAGSPETKSARTAAAKQFPIVGVGASAGGLEAFTQLLEHLPSDTGMGFVLVQHLDRDHPSALTQILTRATSMHVQEVTDKLRIEPNNVYVIPRDRNMSIVQGLLRLQARPEGRTPLRSIDSFLESLATDQRDYAIGVILSGTATDGTMGLEAIKGEGGITFAQDESAKYDSMPRSAVAAGCVDLVLSPQKIAEELVRIANHPLIAGAGNRASALLRTEAEREADQHGPPGTPLASGGHGTPPTGSALAMAEAKSNSREAIAHEELFKKILGLVRNHSGVNFLLYKSSTIQRRIMRRMVLNKHETLKTYADFLRGNAKELDALYSDMLIAVTSFFRNPETFDALRHIVFPKILAQRSDQPVRIWVLGCSTGQEAYSMAMTFEEAAEGKLHARKVQIFATDLNEAMLEKARAGLYAKNLAQDISPERLRRFFVEEEGGYRVCKPLRQMVVFARQNLANDPPFSHMDLVSCRNLLIYLQPDLQKKIMPMFHYALNPEGYLLLGASESVSGFGTLFEPLDRKHKIFLRKPGRAGLLHLSVLTPRPAEKKPTPRPRPSAPVPDTLRAEAYAQREADRLTISQYAPPAVLINADLQVLQFRGPTAAYLEPPLGSASFHVLKMAREGLMLPLRAAINKAKKENKPVRQKAQVTQNGRARPVIIEALPLNNLRERCYLILFRETKAGHAPDDALFGERRGDTAPTQRHGSKREETSRIRELERELGDTRDYLQSVQEQYEAASEELQAQGEEVESANEELQSINEELETSKEELESSNEELTTLNDEMSNRNLELNLTNADLSNLNVSINTAILVLGRDLTIRRFTPPAQKIFNLTAADVGRPLGGIRHNLVQPSPDRAGTSRDPEIESPISYQQRTEQTSRVAAESTATPTPSSEDPRERARFSLDALIAEVVDTVQPVECEVQDKLDRWYRLRIRPYMTLENKVDGAVLILNDIDAIKRSEREIKSQRDYAEAILREVGPLLILDKSLVIRSANEAFYKHYRVNAAQTVNRLVYDLGNGQWNIPQLRTLLEEVLPRQGVVTDFEVVHDFPRIGRRTILLQARQLASHESILLRIDDVTDRLQWQVELRRSELRYRRLFEAAHDGILIVDPASRKITEANPYMSELLGRPREELPGKELWELGLLKKGPASDTVFRELEKKSSVRCENLSLKARGGSPIELEFVANRYDEGGLKVIQFNIRDITERMQALEAVSRSEEKFKLLFQLSPLPKWLFDLQTFQILDVNEAALRHYGYSREEFLLLSILDIRTRESGEALKKMLAGEENHLPQKEVCKHRRKNGEIIDVEVWGGKISLADKPVWIASIVDVTAARKAQEAERRALAQLTNQAAHLEQLVQERTRALRETVGELETFSYSLAHDLRAPLRTITNFADVIHAGYSERLDDEGRDFLKRIGSSAARMDMLIQEVLSYTRVARMQVALTPVDLDKLVRDIVANYPNFQPPRIDIKIEGTLPPVRGHSGFLTQVLSNLLGNAVKFVAPGVQSKVRIWAEERAASPSPESEEQAEGVATPVVRLSIQDNGIGIAPEDHARIFRMFERIHPASEFEGTGIGLTIVRKAVERLGGRAGFESALGQGSTFWFELQKAK